MTESSGKEPTKPADSSANRTVTNYIPIPFGRIARYVARTVEPMSLRNRLTLGKKTTGTLLALSAATAVAATTLTAAPALSTPTTDLRSSVRAPKQAKIDPVERDRIRTQYGVFPLPVPERAITRWRLKRKDLKEIAAARRLAESPKGRAVRKCESHHNYRLAYGIYYGAWQFDRQTWLSNGGGRFGRTANQAPPWAQDLIMWKTHRARGWQPWGCA